MENDLADYQFAIRTAELVLRRLGEINALLSAFEECDGKTIDSKVLVKIANELSWHARNDLEDVIETLGSGVEVQK